MCFRERMRKEMAQGYRLIFNDQFEFNQEINRLAVIAK